MLNKKVMVLVILLVSLFVIPLVSAADNVTDNIVSIDKTDETSVIDINNPIVVSGNDEISVKSQEDNELGISEKDTLTVETGSFKDLAEEIMWANGELNLTKNYVYSTNDSYYKHGININYKITINGNGFVIDGNSQARAFKINSYYVTLNNISFVNCYAADEENGEVSGGAILFSGNNGLISNCSFRNCFALGDGGAIRQAERDSYDFKIINCNFTNNKAAQSGGAVKSGYDSACNITRCNFISNTARNGGATSYSSVKNSFFDSNHASENGGAMYKGDGHNCIFKDNTADIASINGYDTIMSRSILNISTFPSTCQYGSKLKFNFTTMDGQLINYATITIKVYKENALVGTYKASSGDGWIVKLDEGDYEVICSVEDQDYYVNSDSTFLKITKISTNIISSDITTVYNSGANLVITLKDAQGNPIKDATLSVKFNGVKTVTQTTNKDGQVKVTTNGLAPKTSYATTITFAGNKNYAKSTKTVKVTVKKAAPKMTANAKTFILFDKTKKYTVTLKTNQNKIMKNAKVTLTVNKKTYGAKTNTKGVATFKLIKLTKKGKYTATVKYAGSKYYNAKTVKPKITIM